MDLLSILRAVGRRWWVAVLVVGATALLGYTMIDAFPPTVTMEGRYLLVGSQPDGEAEGTETATADVATAEVATAVLTSTGFGDAADGLGETRFSVRSLVDSPVLVIEVTGESEELATDGLDVLLSELDGIVADLRSRSGSSEGEATVVLGRGVERSTDVSGDTEDGVGDDDVPAGPVARATVLVRGTDEAQAVFEASDYTAAVLQSSVADQPTTDRLTAPDGVETFEFGFDDRRAAPVIQLRIIGTDRDAVVAAFDEAESVTTARLEELQTVEGEAQGTTTTLAPLSRPDGPTDVESNRRRPLAIIVLLGVLVAVAAAVAVDRIMTTRERRRARPPTGPPPADASDDRVRAAVADDLW